MFHQNGHISYRERHGYVEYYVPPVNDGIAVAVPLRTIQCDTLPARHILGCGVAILLCSFRLIGYKRQVINKEVLKYIHLYSPIVVAKKGNNNNIKYNNNNN